MEDTKSTLMVVNLVEVRLLEQGAGNANAGALLQGHDQTAPPKLSRKSSEGDEFDKNVASAGGSVFDVGMRCNYLQVQGDGYMKLYEGKRHKEEIRLQFAKRALAAYESATDLASSSLDSTDPLRLLIVCSYCYALHTLPKLSTDVHHETSSNRKARKLAAKTYDSACRSPIALTDESVYLLQMLRDRWMVLPRTNTAKGECASSNKYRNTGSDTEGEHTVDDGEEISDPESGDNDDMEDENEVEKHARLLHESNMDDNALAAKLRQKEKLKAKAKNSAIAQAKRAKETGKKGQSLGKHNNEDNIEMLGVFAKDESERADRVSYRIKSAQKQIRRLRLLVAPPLSHGEENPVILLDAHIAHSSHLKTALKRIFNIYIQGTALVGLQTQNMNVEIPDGQIMSMGNFLLEGPFMGFHGFASVLRDFGICKIPLNKAKVRPGDGGKRGRYYGDGCFPSIFDAGDALHLFHNGDPPLSIKDATLLFIECSRSSRPVLTKGRYLAKYQEMQDQADAFEDSFAQPLEWAALPIDTWSAVSSGLNFMQFLDFIGKAAVVAYSTEQFDEILPSNVEKIEHFLHAQMGLLDARRWLPKVEGRLHSLRVQINEKLSEKPKSTSATASASAIVSALASAAATPRHTSSNINSNVNTNTSTNNSIHDTPFIHSYK